MLRKAIKALYFKLKYSLIFVFCLFSLHSTVGCLKTDSNTGAANSSSSRTTSNTVDLGFAGVSSVENIDGSTIKISWSAATNSTVTAYRVYEVSANGDLNAIIQLPSTFLTYYHTGLVEKTFHSYVVRAVNSLNQTDGNTVTKLGYTYSGATNFTPTGSNSATITFNASGYGTLGANVYAIARGQTFFLGTSTNTATSMNTTALKSGVTYQIKVNAIISAGVEDTNVSRPSGQTTPLNATRYKGPLLVQAYGNAPGAPTGTPTSRQVSLTWLGFTSNTSTTTYKVVRVIKDGSIDVTTNTNCTSSTTTSCNVVCASGSTSLTGAGARTCIDTNVDAPPVAYDYIVTLDIGGWPEELLSSQANSQRITVHIPPDNMVLIHRDSVNYEQCSLMSRTSDPLNRQRCSYTGLGATPYNSGSSLNSSALNLSGLYYDFGYNLFVDRWEAACNWSRSAATLINTNPATYGTGKCGAGGTNGDCFGVGSPVGTIGDVGNVYFDTFNGICHVKTGPTTWNNINTAFITASERLAMYTNDPAAQNGQRPPMTSLNQARAQDTCATVIDSNYGAKRLLRLREYKAAAAWANITGEPGALSDSTIQSIESTSGASTHTTLNYCNTNTHSGVTPADSFGQSGYELAMQSVSGMDAFVIGSNGTKACISRFGIQDAVGNVSEILSDQISCNAGTKVCTGIQSSVENGNGFSSGFDMNGFLFDGSTNGPGGLSITLDNWDLFLGSNSSTHFNTTLGIPLINSNSNNAVLTSAFHSSSKFHGDYFWLSPASTTVRMPVVGSMWSHGTSAGRWSLSWASNAGGNGNSLGFRCALPAE